MPSTVPHAGVHRLPEHVSGPTQKIGLRRASSIRIPGAAPWGAAFLPAGATGGRVVERGSDATAFFIHEVA